MSYIIHILVYFEIYLIVALSLNLVVGFCGMLTLAHAAHFALGAYAYALLVLVFGWGFLPAALASAMLTAISSLAVSLPAWRLRGDFFMLSSLAVQVLIYTLAQNWSDPSKPLGSWANMTNGPFGISAIPSATIAGIEIKDAESFLVLSTLVALTCAAVVLRLQTSPWGRLLIAMREDELAARSLGKNTRILKVQAVAVSAFLAALAGVLYALHFRYIDPNLGSIEESILMLSMILVGGAGNFRGPLIGALILISLPESIRMLSLPPDQAANLRMAFYGLSLILLMHFRPQGIAGEYRVK